MKRIRPKETVVRLFSTFIEATENGSSTTTTTAETATDLTYKAAKPFSTIPGPPQWPIFGNLLDYKLGPFDSTNYHRALLSRYEKYGPLVRENFGGRRLVHIFEPDDARTVFTNEGKLPYIAPLQETAQMYRTMRQLSLGLGNMNGEEWYRLKRNVQQAMMRPRSVFAYIPMVDEVARDFIEYLRSKRDRSTLRIRDFVNDVAKWSLESSAMLVFETRLGSFDENSANEQNFCIQKMIDANATMFCMAGALKFSLPLYKYVSTPKWRRLVDAEDYFYAQVQRLFKETFEKIMQIQQRGESIGENKFNFMGYLLSRPELTQNDIYIICLSLFGDGLNTTAPALIYNIYCLARNREAQEKLREEISKKVPSPNVQLTSESLQNMPYLKACVKEAFRLYPIGTEVTRVIQKNLVLSGYQVPAGTQVEINMGPQLISEKYFAEPTKYIPERWLRGENKSADSHPFVLTPFGHGPRMCAGRRFAEQDLYVSLVKIFQTFKIDHLGPTMEQEMHTLLLPTNADKFVFADR